MTKPNKAILERLYNEDIKAKYPNFPYPPPAKYSDKTANGLTKCIIHFLNFLGHQAERISSMGRTIDNRETYVDVVGFSRTIGSTKYIPGTSTRGTADISSTIFGKSVKIEVKIGADKQSAAQKLYEANVNKAGGVYMIAKDFDGFVDNYRATVRRIKGVHISQLGREFVIFSEAGRCIMFLDNFEQLTISKNALNTYL